MNTKELRVKNMYIKFSHGSSPFPQKMIRYSIDFGNKQDGEINNILQKSGLLETISKCYHQDNRKVRWSTKCQTCPFRDSCTLEVYTNHSDKTAKVRGECLNTDENLNSFLGSSFVQFNDPKLTKGQKNDILTCPHFDTMARMLKKNPEKNEMSCLQCSLRLRYDRPTNSFEVGGKGNCKYFQTE